MFSIFRLVKRKKVIAVFDISSASLGGTLFVKKEGERPKVLTSRRVNIELKEEFNASHFNKSLEVAFVNLLELIKKDCSRSPNLILCTLSSLFYNSQTRIIKIKEEKSFKVTEKIISDFLTKEKELFKKSQLKTNKIFNSTSDMVVFENSVMKTILNGYKCANPTGQKVKTLEIHTHMSVGSKKIKNKIEDILKKNFSASPITFNTFPFIAYNSLSATINAEDGFLLIDISGEITDVSLIKQNELGETITFPIGKNFLLRKISSTLNKFIKGSSSVLERSNKGHGSSKINDKLSSIFKEVGDKWYDSFKKTVSIFKEGDQLPNQIFLIGHDKIVEEFSKNIKLDPYF